MADLLPAVEIGPAKGARGAVIWLHGLGADGNDFAPLIPMLGLPDVRFVLPHAPRIPVTLNNGWEMPAWYDIRTLEEGPQREDLDGLRASAARIEALIAREAARGVPASRLVLAGFSQGGAVALHVALRHPSTLLGLLALSTYLIAPSLLAAEANAANAATPLLSCHGRYDPTVPVARGRKAFDTLAAGRDATWRDYPMGHEVCPEEIRDVRTWLHARFATVGTAAGAG